MKARLATPADAAPIAAIYNQGIVSRLATFETELRSPEEVARWFETPYPVVVVEAGADDNSDGDIVAFAATASYNPRACYAGIGEFLVYVDLGKQQQGLGRMALEALFPIAAERGLYKLVSRVFTQNYASRRLLASVGFREVGVFKRHGQVEGEWRDAVIVERFLDEST